MFFLYLYKFVHNCSFFSFSDHLSWMFPAHSQTFAIFHLLMLLKILGLFMVLMFLCPGANDLQIEQVFLDTSFKVFNEFITHKFSSRLLYHTL